MDRVDTEHGMLQAHTPCLTTHVDAALHVVTTSTTHAWAIPKERFIACARRAGVWKQMQLGACVMLAKMVTPGERTKEQVDVIETYVHGRCLQRTSMCVTWLCACHACDVLHADCVMTCSRFHTRSRHALARL